MNLLQIFSIMMTIFATSDALVCYHCRFCDDIFQTPYIFERNCSGIFGNPSCEKLVYELDNSSRGVIVRRCQFTIFLANASTIGSHGAREQKYPVDYIQQHYLQLNVRLNTSRAFVTRISVFHCQTDYCNSTSTLSRSHLIIFVFILSFLRY